MEPTPNSPVLRTVNLSHVFRLKQKLQQKAEPWLGKKFRREDLYDLAATWFLALKKQTPVEVVFQSIRHLIDREATPELLATEAWRLAGNLRQLQNLRDAGPWVRQEFDEWVPVQIVDCQVCRTRRKDLAAQFTGRVLAGTSTSMLIDFLWKHKFCKFISSELGFSAPWGKLPFTRMEELVGLRFYALMMRPTKDQEVKERRPWFRQVSAPPGLVTYNRTLIKRRRRIKFACPRGYSHPCHFCHIGYRDCELAVHPRTYVRDNCTACKQESWFDPNTVAMGVCVLCRLKKELTNA